MSYQFPLGILTGIFIAVLAWRAGSLSRSGAWAAAITGGLIFGLGGLPWATLLLIFFVSSSALSRAFRGRKRALSEKFAKGSQRDWGQVSANGGLGVALVIAQTIWPDASWPWLAYAGAMASVNADTWATELGVLNPRPPRRISDWQVVESGTSGGVSLGGTAAALAGAVVVGLAAAVFTPDVEWLPLLGWVSLAGLLGAGFDSYLGATVQAIYHCPACRKETERHPQHLCGAATTPLRGWPWLNNDLVNVAASLVGAALMVWWG